MTIMVYGKGRQSPAWHVLEKRAPQYLRIYLIDGGSGMYEDGVARFPLKKDHLYIFPAQSAYEMTQNPEDPIDCLWMHADVFPYIVDRPIELNPAEHTEIALTLSLLRMQLDRQVVHSGCAEAFAQAVLNLLVRDGIFSRKIEGSLFMQDAFFGSVREISRRAGYSQEHFIRSFTRHAGITPYQYIVSQRMNEAVSLLRQGLTMEEIALRVGYSCGKAFSGAFKRKFGIAPELYRKYFMGRA